MVGQPKQCDECCEMPQLVSPQTARSLIQFTWWALQRSCQLNSRQKEERLL